METLPVLSVCVTLDVIVVQSSFFAFFFVLSFSCLPYRKFSEPNKL